MHPSFLLDALLLLLYLNLFTSTLNLLDSDNSAPAFLADLFLYSLRKGGRLVVALGMLKRVLEVMFGDRTVGLCF